jgi:hypothetical protein
MTEDQIKQNCEKQFQNGGSRVVILSSNGYNTGVIVSSVPEAKRLTYLEEMIYARRKVRNEQRYEWVKIK